MTKGKSIETIVDEAREMWEAPRQNAMPTGVDLLKQARQVGKTETEINMFAASQPLTPVGIKGGRVYVRDCFDRVFGMDNYSIEEIEQLARSGVPFQLAGNRKQRREIENDIAKGRLKKVDPKKMKARSVGRSKGNSPASVSATHKAIHGLPIQTKTSAATLGNVQGQLRKEREAFEKAREASEDEVLEPVTLEDVKELLALPTTRREQLASLAFLMARARANPGTEEETLEALLSLWNDFKAAAKPAEVNAVGASLGETVFTPLEDDAYVGSDFDITHDSFAPGSYDGLYPTIHGKKLLPASLTKNFMVQAKAAEGAEAELKALGEKELNKFLEGMQRSREKMIDETLLPSAGVADAVNDEGVPKFNTDNYAAMVPQSVVKSMLENYKGAETGRTQSTEQNLSNTPKTWDPKDCFVNDYGDPQYTLTEKQFKEMYENRPAPDAVDPTARYEDQRVLAEIGKAGADLIYEAMTKPSGAMMNGYTATLIAEDEPAPEWDEEDQALAMSSTPEIVDTKDDEDNEE